MSPRRLVSGGLVHALSESPIWHAAQRDGISVLYRIVGGHELQEAVRLLGPRALAACERENAPRLSPSPLKPSSRAPPGTRRP